MGDDGDGGKVFEFRAGLLQCVINDGQDPLNVGPRGDFRDDPSEPPMQVALRRHDAGAHDEIYVKAKCWPAPALAAASSGDS